LPLATACVQQYPAIVARELGEVSTDGQDHPLRTPPAGGAAETEDYHLRRFTWQDQC
jgi:hypothetical protein